MKEITIEDVLKKYIYKNIEGFGDGVTVAGAEAAMTEYASLNRQGCRWTKASNGVPVEPDLKHWRFSETKEPAFWPQIIRVALSENNSDDVEWLDESIEPCATSSENYWKQVIEKRIVYFASKWHKFEARELQGALNTIERLVPPEQFETPSPTGDRDTPISKVKKLMETREFKSESGDRDCEELKDMGFIQWYSGMEEYKIRNAYERYKREIEQGQP